MKKSYLKMPWSMEDSIENLRDIKAMMQQVLLRANKDGKGKEDAKEVAFDFDRAINALEKQIPKKPRLFDCDYSYFECDNCGARIWYSDEAKTHRYCLNCGQALDWSEVQEE